jgi:hypothetical protein
MGGADRATHDWDGCSWKRTLLAGRDSPVKTLVTGIITQSMRAHHVHI